MHPKYILTSVLSLAMLSNLAFAQKVSQPDLGAKKASIISVGKLKFKDLNKNNKLDA